MAHMHVGMLTIMLILLTHGNTINAGITRQLDQLLPMRERITRSVPQAIEDKTKSLETIPSEDIACTKYQRLSRPARSANNYDLNTAENNVVFKPLFRKRPNRRIARSVQSLDLDMQTAENNVVFKPLFRRKPNRRIARSVSNLDDLLVSENNIVFKPLFRRRHNYRRVRRDANSDMQTAENNVVFKPLFRRKPVRRVRSADDLDLSESSYASNYHVEDAHVDNIYTPTAADEVIEYDEDDEEAEETRAKRDTQSQNADELLDTAANSIVFRPLFRNSRRNLIKRRN